MRAIGVIPARLSSTRMKHKVLVDILGKPMIQHVWERAIQSDLSDVIIATDSSVIYEAAESFGAKVVMTSPDHISGTSRIVELVQHVDADFYINIQGDEPLISPNLINDLINAYKTSPDRDVYTAANPECSEEEMMSPDVVKVVVDQNGDALYFSRAPIPYFRNTDTDVFPLKHVGIYGYTRHGLLLYDKFGPGKLERTELLEQLRFLENGVKIKVILTPYMSIGVDTEKDLEKVLKILTQQKCTSEE